jgi:hypothetical protein
MHHVHCHQSSKITSPKEVTKQYESRFFLLFLLDDGRIRIHTIMTDPDGPETSGTTTLLRTLTKLRVLQYNFNPQQYLK